VGELIRTALMGNLMPRLSRVHERRRIGVFAGPSGIGKTTTIRAFAAERENVLIVNIPPGPKSGVRPTVALHLVLSALYDFADTRHVSNPGGYVELRNRLYGILAEWSGGDAHSILTIVFDEAQNLSEDAIETFRYFNDAGTRFSPFPIGLVFIGNNKFRLKTDHHGQSVLTEAVKDRAIYTDLFLYEDVTDDDFQMFLESRGLVDPEALRLVLRYFRTGRIDRSFRQLENLLDELAEEASGAPITAKTFKTVIGLE
jgi:DNA transposition AAA+ family ATPase